MGANESNKTSDKETIESLSRFPWRVRVSAYSFEDPALHVPPNLTLKEVGTVFPSRSCIPNFDGIDLSGGSVTDSAGRMTWRMLDFVCPDRDYLVDFPVSFVATPLSDKPAYMTVKFMGFRTLPNDVVIEVYSWDSTGKPAPYMNFYWRCRIPLGELILGPRPTHAKLESP